MDEFVVIALGANLSLSQKTPIDILGAACHSLSQSGFFNLRASRVWKSLAWPDPTHPPYYNQVAVGAFAGDPVEALERLLRIEAEFGRERSLPNAPRTLDLDLIALGSHEVSTEHLILPHPRAHTRRFVMGPLSELAPGYVLPGRGITVARALLDCSVGLDAEPLEL